MRSSSNKVVAVCWQSWRGMRCCSLWWRVYSVFCWMRNISRLPTILQPYCVTAVWRLHSKDICTAVAEPVSNVFPRMISMVTSLTSRDTIRRLHISGNHHWSAIMVHPFLCLSWKTNVAIVSGTHPYKEAVSSTWPTPLVSMEGRVTRTPRSQQVNSVQGYQNQVSRKTAEELYNEADLKHWSKLIKLLCMITANNPFMSNKTVFKF